MDMSKENVTSPCISVCKTDPVSGFCYGCGRTDEEKNIWKNENTSNQWKLENLTELKKRLRIFILNMKVRKLFLMFVQNLFYILKSE